MLQPKAQTFNDGVVKIYTVTNSAAPGKKPVINLTLKETLRYHERTVGITRYFAAKQANVKIDYVLRVPRQRNVSAQDGAIPNDGQLYNIELVQYPEDNPHVMDLTLSVIKADYTIHQTTGLNSEEDGGEGGA